MVLRLTGDLQGAAFADFTGGDFSGKKYYKANFKGEYGHVQRGAQRGLARGTYVVAFLAVMCLVLTLFVTLC